MGDEHLDTISETESDEVIKSCVENLVPNPSESEGENGCDVPSCFTTFSNILFDDEYEFDSVDDQSLHNEYFSEKIFSNLLFEEEIISIKKNQHHFNAEPNGEAGEALRKCILSGPYKPTTVLVQAVDATDDSSAIPEHTTVETPMNMSPKNKAHFEAEKEAIHLILTGIRDEIYSTVDACQTTQEIHKGKKISKPFTPPSETAFEEDSDPEQAQKDKNMQKNLALIAKYFKKIYKPTNNNLIKSSNSRNKNVDTTPRKPKKVKDSAYHKEKMLLCKQSKQADTGTDSEPVKQVKNDAGYNVFANDLQHSEQSESVSNTCLVETDNSNVIPDSPDMCEDDIQNEQYDVECDDERVSLANLIANLKLDNKQTEFEKYKAFNDRTIDYDKLELVKENHDELIKQSLLTKSHYEGLVKKKTKTQNDSFRFVHELKQEMHADLKYVESLEKEIEELKSDKAEFSNMYGMILQECVSKDVMCSYLLSLSDLDALDELQCLYLHKVKECDCLAQKLSHQTESVSKEIHFELLKRFAKVEKHLISLEIALQKRKE
uniref:Uncharacterized protein n=1 Tax=Tanacetum cinerariifolium TaxID=118510 RepID=A0A6L2K5Y5_TANCI|nr:hypothetical protein [Tanacetum cinerariifolium]